MFVAVVNQKGGVGKSTLAVHLAAWHQEQGRRVALIDADMQGSSAKWIGHAVPEVVVESIYDPNRIIERAQSLKEEGVDVIVADGPPGLSETTRALLLVADLALVPCGPSLLEIEAAATALRVVKTSQAVRNGLPKALVALNRLQHDHYTLTRETRDAVAQLDVAHCENVLRLRQSVADAPGQRDILWRMGGKSRVAAQEMRTVLEEVNEHALRAIAYGRSPMEAA